MAAPKRRLRRLSMLAGLCLVGPAMVAAPQGALGTPPAPVILNAGAQNGPDAQWAETQAQPDDGAAGTKQFIATFLVRHAPGRAIIGLRVDADFDGADDTSTSPITGVTAQTYGFSGLIETSRITAFVPLSKPAGFTCSPTTGALRSVDAPVRVRVVDSTGEQSATVSTVVKFVEDLNCLGFQDFPRLTSTSQHATEVTPGQSIFYTFTCSDPDTDAFSTDDDCDRANIRWRRLNDGTTSPVVLKTGMADDTNQIHQLSFPSRGYYVVEAQLGNENGSFPNTGGSTGGWWRLGNAVVNESSLSLTGSLSFPGANASTPPSVNAGTAISAVVTAADLGGGIQIIEWDATSNGTFERREYTVPSVVGGDMDHPQLTAAELSQAVSTDTPGLVTVGARITDNGALDAADALRRQLSFSGQLRINALPTATDVTTATNEDSAVTVTLAGGDTDAQPEALTYEIVSGPDAGAGSLGAVSGNQVEFTPAPGFSGSASFTYRTRDGSSATVAAWAYSEPATVQITVAAVNDAPIATDQAITVSSKSSVTISLAATDVDGDALTFTAPVTSPTRGTVVCLGGSCTYTPNRAYHGPDSFTFRVDDGNGGTDMGTISITVTPGKRPPGRP